MLKQRKVQLCNKVIKQETPNNSVADESATFNQRQPLILALLGPRKNKHNLLHNYQTVNLFRWVKIQQDIKNTIVDIQKLQSQLLTMKLVTISGREYSVSDIEGIYSKEDRLHD